MASRFTKPSINWKELEKLVPADQKANFLTFKGRSDSYLRRVLSNPPDPPKIDWAMYQKFVPVPGLVDKFKSAYEAYKIPVPADSLTAAIDQQWAALQPEIKQYCAERQKDIDESTKEISRIKALPQFEEMTMEIFYDMYPGTAIDPVNRPTFWPHNLEEQPSYRTAEQKDLHHLDPYKP